MTKRQRNLLFITSDQLRADACFGDFVKTPNLDKLRQDGSVTFMRHYANSVPCAPARATLHTGTYSMNNHVHDNGCPLSESISNWANELRTKMDADPVLIGYVDQTIDVSIHSEDDERIQQWEGGHLPGLRRLTETDVMGTPKWLEERNISAGAFSTGHQGWNGYNGDQSWMRQQMWDKECEPYPLPTVYKAEDSDTRVLTERAIQFIQNSEGPFHVHLSLLKPHPPWAAPEPFNEMYKPEDIARSEPVVRCESVEAESQAHPWLKMMHEQDGGLSIFGANATAKEIDDDELYMVKSSYYALISEMDHNLGLLFDSLKETGQWDNTLIVFTSDHGEMMGDHWFMGKLGFHEKSYHIPLVIRDPTRLARDEFSSEKFCFTENVDIMPTILEWFDIKSPHQCDGRSVIPILEKHRGKEPEYIPIGWRSAAHYEVNYSSWGQLEDVNDFHGKSLGLKSPDECYLCVTQEDRFKLVYFLGNLPPLLFDLKSDPGELENLANQPEHKMTLIRMLSEMLDWRMTYSGAVHRHLKKTKINYSNQVVSRL
mmetsp:Transcript_9040/g.10836  ORF Transcript_9040/g.10836 Transcript_9040/m.10836 type:complete len:542 (+) Transcript_9040:199-1824(+)|eukprot:CAMPEP_0184030876 /NCGR_PEP_ID=MMETSP0955-20130417/1796_1 /TAXON_ID=627963 /ORGANISM="Aplanochytrium sp, Strain PBS07" /LENGTH=541 /DNA_ID=CAMNT_0026316437 /DNA_START=177 /DNA_END=1802 /DNA_ORIENTATION=-